MRYCTSTSTLGVRRSYNKSESRAHIILCFVFYIVLGGGTWPSGSPPSRITRITDIYNTAARVYSMRCGLTATSLVPRWLESERYASAVMTSVSLCTLAHWVGMRSQLSYLCLVPILKDWLWFWRRPGNWLANVIVTSPSPSVPSCREMCAKLVLSLGVCTLPTLII